MVVEEPPLLWPASHHSASPAVNFLPEDSVSGVQLCPQVLGVKKEQSNYSTSRLTLVRASLLYAVYGLKTALLRGLFRQKRQKCVKNVLTLLPYCAF